MSSALSLRVAVLTVVFSFLASAALAAMTGGLAAPLEPSKATMSVTLAYAERDVEDGARDEARSRKLLFKGAFGVANGADMYAFLGLTDMSYRGADFDGSLGENVGLGFRYTPPQLAPGTNLVFDLQGEYAASADGDDEVEYQAYHAAIYLVSSFGAGGRTGYFYPFGGVRFSYADYDNNNFADYKSDDVFGLLAGADYFVNPNVFFTGEFHLFDENSFYLSAGYRF